MNPSDDTHGSTEGARNRFAPLPDPNSLSTEELLALNADLAEYLRQIARVVIERLPLNAELSARLDSEHDVSE
jgi:hypothetical protein